MLIAECLLDLSWIFGRHSWTAGHVESEIVAHRTGQDMDPTPKKVLIVYPEDRVLDRFRRGVEAAGFSVRIECHHRMPPSGLDDDAHELLIAHAESPIPDGTALIDHLFRHPPAKAVILVSEIGSIRHAVQAMRLGVVDYLIKDCAAEAISAATEHALGRFRTENVAGEGRAADHGPRPMITRAEAMQILLNTARRVADAAATVLIQGESGTGKELLARYIHAHSRRRERPLVAMNCAALPENLAESELFGYEKGAFTGAARKRTGKFEQAHLSTLLLDEISEMSLALQVKLLRVLQEKEVDPIGGKSPIPVDARIIATTNRSLAAMVKAGEFREDLFYRLRVIPLKIPPLRERREDIPLLAEHFLTKHCPEHLDAPPRLSTEAMEALTAWTWPGNVRELENTIERAILIEESETIGTQSLLLDDELTSLAPDRSQVLVGSTVREMEQKLISATLDHLNHNRTHAAKMLGISIRTLRNKLKEYQDQPAESFSAPVGAQSPR